MLANVIIHGTRARDLVCSLLGLKADGASYAPEQTSRLTGSPLHGTDGLLPHSLSL